MSRVKFIRFCSMHIIIISWSCLSLLAEFESFSAFNWTMHHSEIYYIIKLLLDIATLSIVIWIRHVHFFFLFIECKFKCLHSIRCRKNIYLFTIIIYESKNLAMLTCVRLQVTLKNQYVILTHQQHSCTTNTNTLVQHVYQRYPRCRIHCTGHWRSTSKTCMR